jgi:hypothetical protein
MKEGRINLRPYLCEFSETGFPINPTEENFKARYQENPDQRIIDLYTLLVPIIDSSVQIAMNERPQYPPFGLQQLTDHTKKDNKQISSFPHHDPFTALMKSMEATLKNSVAKNPAINTLYDNSGTREAFDTLSLSRSGRVLTTALINGGIGTAVRTMTNTLRLIPELCSKQYPDDEPSAARLSLIAQKNYPFVLMLAKLHLEQISRVEHHVKKSSVKFPSELFYLNERNVIVPNPEGEQLIFTADDTDYLDKWGQRETIGCPAAYSRALKSLWDWHAELAEPVYQSYLAGRER